MKKLLVVLIAALLFVSCGVCASASETEGDTVVTEKTDNVYENEEPKEESDNPFAVAYNYVSEHADDLFSLLAFVGSLAMAVVYKKGLLPQLSTALGNIRTSVKSIGDTAEKTLAGSEGALSEVRSKMELVGSGLDTLCTAVADLDKRLAASEEQANEAKAMKTIMSAQVDMLYSIFMSSALPQYSKDAVGERISEMKAALAEPVTGDE